MNYGIEHLLYQKTMIELLRESPKMFLHRIHRCGLNQSVSFGLCKA